MTLNALALELIRAHKENAGDADYVLTVEQWIRDALQELAIDINLRAFVDVTTLATVASTRVYTLPVSVRDIELIRDPPTETDIVYKTKAELVFLGLDLEHISRPSFWYYEEPDNSVPADVKYKIGFQPIPDAIYTLDVTYRLNPSTIASGSHIPVQDDYLMPIKFSTRASMSLDDKDTDSADRFFSRYFEKIDKLKRRENTKANDRPRLQMRDIPGRGADRRLSRLDPNHFG